MAASSNRFVFTLFVVGAGVAMRQQPPVVNNPAPNFAAPSFALGQPVFVVDGNVTGDSLSELYSVSDAALSSKGTLIVINNAGASIREYDRTGRFLRAISRKGAGPGEYQAIANLRVLDGDTVVFFDGIQNRITVLGPDRRHARTVGAVRRAICCSMTGAFVERASFPSPAGGRSWSAGSLRHYFGNIRQDGAGAFVFNRDSAPQASLPGYASAFTVTQQFPGVPNPSWITYPVPFTIAPVSQWGVDELIIGTGDRFEYQVVDGRGVLLRTVRAAAPVRPVTAEMIANQRARLTRPGSNAPGVPEKLGAAFDTLPLPKTLPAYDRLYVEEDGTVWLRDYLIADSLPQQWASFDRRGALRGTLILPANLTAFRFSRGHAIVAVRDTTLDFQRVTAYPIVRK